MQLTALAVVASAALLLGYIINTILDNRRHAARAREMGCGPIVRTPTVEPSGIVNAVRSAHASRQKRFPVWIEEQLERVNAAHGRPVGTVNLRTPFFRDTVFTIDPQNIQAVLATKFKDFGLGPNRTENFAPLLGNGIVRCCCPPPRPPAEASSSCKSNVSSLRPTESSGSTRGPCCARSSSAARSATSTSRRTTSRR